MGRGPWAVADSERHRRRRTTSTSSHPRARNSCARAATTSPLSYDIDVVATPRAQRPMRRWHGAPRRRDHRPRRDDRSAPRPLPRVRAGQRRRGTPTRRRPGAPHRVVFRVLARPRERAAVPAPQGPVLGAVRWTPRTGRPRPRRCRPSRGPRGVRHRRPRPARRLRGRPRPARPARGFACAAHWDVGFVAVVDPARTTTVSDESDDVRWFALDALPEGLAPGLPARLAAVVATVAHRD